jgi:hypothetical protein
MHPCHNKHVLARLHKTPEKNLNVLHDNKGDTDLYVHETYSSDDCLGRLQAPPGGLTSRGFEASVSGTDGGVE